MDFCSPIIALRRKRSKWYLKISHTVAIILLQPDSILWCSAFFPSILFFGTFNIWRLRVSNETKVFYFNKNHHKTTRIYLYQDATEQDYMHQQSADYAQIRRKAPEDCVLSKFTDVFIHWIPVYHGKTPDSGQEKAPIINWKQQHYEYFTINRWTL